MSNCHKLYDKSTNVNSSSENLFNACNVDTFPSLSISAQVLETLIAVSCINAGIFALVNPPDLLLMYNTFGLFRLLSVAKISSYPSLFTSIHRCCYFSEKTTVLE